MAGMIILFSVVKGINIMFIRFSNFKRFIVEF